MKYFILGIIKTIFLPVFATVLILVLIFDIISCLGGKNIHETAFHEKITNWYLG